ncbi:MAG: hypothetical protein IPJ08_13530 [Burkholderiales bacterium]|nr:hypothetical protein [Burkholderiales bacterium]
MNLKTKCLNLATGFVVLVSTLMTHTSASAVPAFARQTGKACTSCHFQHYPALNEFGAEFKASGYVDIKNKPLAGKDLSLADSLYAGVFTKLRYQKSNGVENTGEKSTHSGELQFPDEFALLLGGRVGKNIGFLIEGQLIDGEAPMLAGFKMPMIWEVRDTMKAGVVPYTTDGLGASYGFELLNTGAVRNVRVSEHRSETSAQQYIFFGGTGPGGDTAGASTGLAFVLHDSLYHVVVNPNTPNHLPGGGNNLGGLDSLYMRAVVTPTVNGWALAAGVQSWSGSNARYGDGSTSVATKGWALDAQAQGVFQSMPLGVYLAHASAPASSAGSAPNLFNAKAKARTATTLTAELGVLPQTATVMLSYRKADNAGTQDNAWSIGGTYHIYQNVGLQLVHSQRSAAGYGPTVVDGGAKGKSMTTLMLSAGF